MVFAADKEPIFTREVENMEWALTGADGQPATGLTGLEVTVDFGGRTYGPFEARESRSEPGPCSTRHMFLEPGDYQFHLRFTPPGAEAVEFSATASVRDRAEITIPTPAVGAIPRPGAALATAGPLVGDRDFAHARQTVGPYALVLGASPEPVYTDEVHRLTWAFTDGAGNPATGFVEGEAHVRFNGVEYGPFEVRENRNAPGTYYAVVIFTRPGSYDVMLHIKPSALAAGLPVESHVTANAAAVLHTPPTLAHGAGVIRLHVGSRTVSHDGRVRDIDAAPYIAADRTMVPFRFIGEALGASVGRDEAERKVTYQLGGRTVVLWLGKATASVDGAPVTLDAAPELKSDRTFVPLRFVSEALNVGVDWDAATLGAVIGH